MPGMRPILLFILTVTILASANTIDYPVVMAGAVVASIPGITLFVFAQRHIIASVSHSGLKG